MIIVGAGDLVVVDSNLTGDGKGYGPPSSRGPALVANDVRNEKLSRANVQERYGVVLKDDSFEVDRTHTERMRIEKGDAVRPMAAVTTENSAHAGGGDQRSTSSSLR